MLDFGSVLLALFGFTVFSTGIVLTKAGGAWLKWKGKKTRGYFKALAVWIFGFIAYNVAAIPNAVASKALPPYIISAISGWRRRISLRIIKAYSKKLIKMDKHIMLQRYNSWMGNILGDGWFCCVCWYSSNHGT